jgi:uncharacterized membrane protein HdeD (DUF308 family)
MLNILVDSWWIVGLRGIGAIIFGVLVLLYPELTVFILLNLFTAYSFVNAFLMIVLTIRGARKHTSWSPFLIMGFVHLAAALACLAFGSIAAVGLFLLIGPWAVVSGIIQIIIGVNAGREKSGTSWAVFGGMVSLIFAVILAVQPFLGFRRFEWLIGSYAIIHGLFFILDSFNLRSYKTV